MMELSWEDGKPVIEQTSTPGVANEVMKYVEHGLHEWHGPQPEDAERRTTMPSDHRFLMRLGEHFRRQFGFSMTLSGELECSDAGHHQRKSKADR